MNLWKFRHRFNKEILMRQNELPNLSNMPGWANERVQNTLNLAVSCLKGTGEAYLEVGSYGGRSLEGALKGNEEVSAYSCDIEYKDTLREVVEKYGVTFFHSKFENAELSLVKHPVGVMYLDNGHEYQETLDHLIKVLPYLADKAMIMVDDHAYARSFNSVRDFVRDHSTNVTIVHELWPECDIFKAMTNHCLNDWINGWCILEYERNPERLPNEIDEDVLGGFHCRSEGPYPVKWREFIKGMLGKDEL